MAIVISPLKINSVWLQRGRNSFIIYRGADMKRPERQIHLSCKDNQRMKGWNLKG